MSSRQSRRSERANSTVTDDQIQQFLSQLHKLIPRHNTHHTNLSDKISAARVVEEACNYIKSMHKEVDDLSERLSELFSTTDTSAQAVILRNLLMQ